MYLLIIIALVVIALAVIVFFKTRQTGDAPIAITHSDQPFTILSNGKLYSRSVGGELTPLQSTYEQEVVKRREKTRAQNSWKEGTSFNVAASGGRRSFGGDDEAPLTATSATYEPDGSLVYFLMDEVVGGLFRYDKKTGNETRLILRHGFHLSDLCSHLDDGQLAASSYREDDGTANIVIMARDGSGFREVTVGDTIDSAPNWVAGKPATLLFQSSGLARNPSGYILAQGNASILELDLTTGALTPILEDSVFDFLSPKTNSLGDLFFIRRPYETAKYGLGQSIMDALLFPFRLLRAVFQYLNFFSLMYTNKPLTSAQGSKLEASMKDILLQGRRIDVEKSLNNARLIHGVASLVPDTWQLVKRSKDGEECVIATNVVTFDINAKNQIVYSNGRGVFVLEPSVHAGEAANKTHLAHANQLVSSLTVPQ